MTILLLEKVNFRAKNIARDVQSYFIVIKGSKCPQKRKFQNKEAKLVDLQREIDKCTIILRGFYSPFQ